MQLKLEKDPYLKLYDKARADDIIPRAATDLGMF